VMDPALFSATQMYVPASCSDTFEMRKRSSSKCTLLSGRAPPCFFHVISGGGSPRATHDRETSLPNKAEVFAGLIVNCGRTVYK